MWISWVGRAETKHDSGNKIVSRLVEKVRETSKPRDGVGASEDLGTEVGERGWSGRELVTETDGWGLGVVNIGSVESCGPDHCILFMWAGSGFKVASSC